MGGGLIQLAAYGSQDIYLTSNPEITYFKAVYRRHSHFASEEIPMIIEGNINFGGNITVVIPRNGDLLGNVSLQVVLPDPTNYVSSPNDYDYLGYVQGIGNLLINNVTIEMGSQQVDQLYGTWMDIWSELSLCGSQLDGYGQMVGRNYSESIWKPFNVQSLPGSRLHIPLPFWFCRNPGLAIPLICTSYCEIKLKFSFNKFTDLLIGIKNGLYSKVTSNGVVPPLTVNNSLKVFGTFYYLDTTEKRKFAQNPHEYLIEQVQTQSGNVLSTTQENYIRVNLNHPTKEMLITFNRNGTNAPLNDYSIGTNIVPNGTVAQFAPLYNYKIIINGSDRFRERPGEYFRTEQHYFHHTRIPGNYIYGYSFSMKPEEHQPSGTCNFSRIDSSQIYFNLRNRTTSPGNMDSLPIEDYTELPSYTIYAPCFNILRFMGGMVGLSFSN